MLCRISSLVSDHSLSLHSSDRPSSRLGDRPFSRLSDRTLNPHPNDRPLSTHNPDSGQNVVNPAPSSSQRFALNNFSRKGLLGQASVETSCLHPLILAERGDLSIQG
jgi:hypothetical protein